MTKTDINSKSNPKIKLARSLYDRKNRDKQNKYIIEGLNQVGVAFESNVSFDFVLYSSSILKSDFANDLLSKFITNGIAIYLVDDEIMRTISAKENIQTIIAVVNKEFENRLLESLNSFDFGVCLDRPQNPGNLGTILRTLDAVNQRNIILLGPSVDPFHPTCIRASMGTIFKTNIFHSNSNTFWDWTNSKNVYVYGSSASGKSQYNKIKYKTPAILLMGSEQKGLSEEILHRCHDVVHIPMEGIASSLNLSVATGLLLYQIYSQ